MHQELLPTAGWSFRLRLFTSCADGVLESENHPWAASLPAVRLCPASIAAVLHVAVPPLERRGQVARAVDRMAAVEFVAHGRLVVQLTRPPRRLMLAFEAHGTGGEREEEGHVRLARFGLDLHAADLRRRSGGPAVQSRCGTSPVGARGAGHGRAPLRGGGVRRGGPARYRLRLRSVGSAGSGEAKEGNHGGPAGHLLPSMSNVQDGFELDRAEPALGKPLRQLLATVADTLVGIAGTNVGAKTPP